MFSLSSELRFHVYQRPTDMRKGFDGLYAIVQGQLRHDPLLGDVYVFINRNRNRIKMLRWEQDGFVIYYKRLEQGTLKNTPQTNTLTYQISWTDLVLLIEGITIEKFHKRKRFSTL